MTVPRPRTAPILRLSAAALAAGVLFAAPAAAAPTPIPHESGAPPASNPADDPNGGRTGDPTGDPALEQSVGADEELLTGAAVVDVGHVDLGPKVVDDAWVLAARDDSVTPAVWRDPNRVAIHVHDAARQTLPEGTAYDFTGARAGDQVWAVPQVEVPGVVWLGWNTQDPAVVQQADRGVTLRFTRVRGPGRMTLFLQPGNFAPPEVLVSSAQPGAQDVFVDANTHTHANWVFTEPGVYLVDVTFLADTAAGQHHEASTTLRFSVGDTTDPQEALDAAAGPVELPVAPAAPPAEAPGAGAVGSAVVPWAAAGTFALIVVFGGVLIAVRAHAAKRAADAAFEESE